MKKQFATLVFSSALLLSGCASLCEPCGDDCAFPEDTVVIQTPATFAFDSAQLTTADKDKLNAVAERLQSNPDEKITVQGYTDNIGTPAYNLKLSQRRADSVAAYLADKGIACDRITTKGYGIEDPVATNQTKEGRALNRRAEIVFHE